VTVDIGPPLPAPPLAIFTCENLFPFYPVKRPWQFHLFISLTNREKHHTSVRETHSTIL
jgi:hypothetical protein